MAQTDFPAPFVARDLAVEEGWIDYNGHMNVAYYIVLFDRCIDDALDVIDMGANYRAREGRSFFTVESHTSYLRELTLGDSAVVDLQFIDMDDKRIHVFQEMRHATEDFVAATLETLLLHVDMDARKTVPFAPDAEARLKAAMSAHSGLPRPERLGRSIGIPSR